MTAINEQINKVKRRIMKDNFELTQLLVERDNMDGFVKAAHFMLAGTMATLHPLFGQRVTYETILAMLDEMGTMPLPKHFDEERGI